VSDVAVARTAAPAPASDRLCDAACIAFALWTLCSHAIVALRGTLLQLLPLYALVIGLAVAAWVYERRRARPEAPLTVDGPARSARRARALRVFQGAALVAGAAAAAGVVAGGIDDMSIEYWWVAVLLLGVAAVALVVSEPTWIETARSGRSLEAALWTLAVACVVVTLVSHRPDIDDAFYINVAVAAADHPDRTLLHSDTLIGNLDLPIHQPAYLVHSYELWNGAISYISGIPAIYCFHWISASLAALLVPLASAKLFRIFTPRIWPWSVAVFVVVLLAAGETHRWYGNFAFVRMWQGKGVYLFVFMPLIYAYAVQFALRPTPARWLWLAAAQVAAVGCSSSAIWAAPAGAWMAMACVLRPTRRGLPILLTGALASAYTLGAGWLLKGELQEFVAPLLKASEPGARLADALSETLGSGHLRSFGIAAILIAWSCSPRGIAQRFAIVAPLAVALVVLNPHWDGWVTANLTGPSYWRAMWSLPVPLLMTLVLVSPLHWDRGRWSRAAGRVGCLALLAAFSVFVPRFSGLSEQNTGSGRTGFRLDRPGLKVPDGAYRWAALLNESVPGGAAVVAPPDISAWVATFHHHANPVVVRPDYHYRHRERLGEKNIQDRRTMTLYAGGVARVDDAAEVFRSGLDRFAIKGVCLRNGRRAPEARAILRALGFRRRLQATDREIWVRS
jgi:hypothetical protein